MNKLEHFKTRLVGVVVKSNDCVNSWIMRRLYSYPRRLSFPKGKKTTPIKFRRERRKVAE